MESGGSREPPDKQVPGDTDKESDKVQVQPGRALCAVPLDQHHIPVPDEILALQHPLPRESLAPRVPALIVPKILKKKEEPPKEGSSVQVATCATAAEAVEQEQESLQWKELPPNVLKRRNCAVACCKTPFPPGVSFHRIPRNPKLRKAWMAACKRKFTFNPETSFVCSQHFKEEDIERDLKSELLNHEKRRKIKFGAVPSLNLLPSAPEVQEVSARTKRAERKEQQNAVQHMMEEEEDYMFFDTAEDTQGRTCEKECQTVEFGLLDENISLRKQVKYLEEQLAQAKRSSTLTEKDKLKFAKEKMYETAWSKQQVDHHLDDKSKSQWKSEDIVLGLTVRSLSHKNYQFLRKRKLLPLPGLTTLKRHIRSFTCSPGIQENVLEGEYC